MDQFLATNIPKFTTLFSAMLAFFFVLAVVFFIAGKANGKAAKPIALLVFLLPAILLILAGLVIPTFRTVIFSFMNANSDGYIGFENYYWIITDPSIRTVLFNTALWTILTPILTTVLGLYLAILLDRMRRESIPKSIIFMPMAISFVGASIIFKFMYEYRDPEEAQIGLLSAIVQALGFGPSNWLLVKPLNTLLLMVVFIWTQTGFAMVILSAAIKSVPADVVEASALDGATGWKLFRGVTFPMVRTTFIVVLATMVVSSLKLFDIVRTMTGGNFGTSVLANEMYSQIFVQFDAGKGSALAVILFLSVTPIFIYNIRTLRKEKAIS
jgi:alpha-glucoside transport system permease protein